MTTFGYKLMSEEQGPEALLHNAVLAERAGFDFVAISDHFHPWSNKQAHSPAAWTVLGAIAARTERVKLVTAVTCPTHRYHPATVAQAAATLDLLSQGRFTLGLGSGESLNEHIVGQGWPSPAQRQDMLFEAVELIERLFTGDEITHEGEFYTLDRAKLWDRPKAPVKLAMAAGGPRAAGLAGERGHGLFTTEPSRELVQAWSKAGGKGARYAEVALCWAKDEASARRIALDSSAFSLLGWDVLTELPTPDGFDAAAKLAREEDIAEKIPCGPDPERHVDAVRTFIEAGFDHIVLRQPGVEQEGFMAFWQHELKPRLAKL